MQEKKTIKKLRERERERELKKTFVRETMYRMKEIVTNLQ